ncbi:toprim domain-containing protein [Mesorhizobium sp.]|uniref:DUF7146 domain-containing protein n=1 Tax=Mesorhizobium sp. TaxID=1871066 RepID=UPI0011F95C0E|nr:toprim domain-containing protein [Mesorhizobium sp.]TIM37655.1 MAG: hypothetical protein E5Y56_32915 [Mesorhizobium sp.]
MTDMRAVARALHGNYNTGRGSASVPGPGHRSRKDRSLEIWIGADGTLAFHSWAGDPRAVVERYLRDFGLEPGAAKIAADFQSRQVAEEQRRRRDDFMVRAAAQLWGEAVDPTHTLAHRYLWDRGLVLPRQAAGRALRFHPSVWWWEEDENGDRRKLQVPALLAKLSFIGTATDRGRAVHAIRLSEDGPGHLGKKTYGSPIGLVCKISPHADVLRRGVLAVGEGIETMIGAMLRYDADPAWALGPEGQLARLPTLHHVQRLDIFADFDGPGLAAAFACARRWQAADKQAAIHRRNQRGADFAEE